MTTEFKKITKKLETRYVLEDASAGATSAGAVASVEMPLGMLQKRLHELKQKVSVPTAKPRNPVGMGTTQGRGTQKHQTTDRKKSKDEKKIHGEDISESGLQYYTGKKKYGADGMKALATAGRKGASQEELGRIKDRYIKKEDHQEQDHEISMASSELQSIAKDAAQLLDMVRQRGEEEGLMAWQQSKITKAADFMNSVLQSLSGDEQGVAEADKHSFIGRIQRHNELKKKVDSTWQDAADAEKRGDKVAANRAFNKHVKYANLERPGTWTDVKEKGVAEGSDDPNPSAGPGSIAHSTPVRRNGKDVGELFQTKSGSWGFFINTSAKTKEGFGSKEKALEAMKQHLGQGVAEGLVGDVNVINYTKVPVELKPGQAQIHGWGPGEQPIYRVKGHDGKEVITSNKRKMIQIAREQGVAEGFGDDYRALSDKVDQYLIKAYHKFNTRDEIIDAAKSASQKAAAQMGIDPNGEHFKEIWMRALSHHDVDTNFGDNDDNFDYTDHSMRKGERGMEEGFDVEISPKTARYVLMKLDQGHNLTDMFDQVPELARMAEIVAGEHRLHLDDDIEQIEQIMINDLNDIVDREEDNLSEYEVYRGADGHYYDDEGNRFDRGFQGSRHKRYVGGAYPARTQTASSSGMYFYNVRPGQETDAQSVGLRQSKNGKWYSKSQNPQADKMFGTGRYWEPKNEDTNEGLRDPKDNPCWKGYKPVGTKKKGGRTVPNCVPVKEDEYFSKLNSALESKLNDH